MKKLYLTLLGLTTLVLVHGQITLNYSSHALRVGDSHDFVFMKETSEGAPGKNIIWDFTGLQPNAQTLTSHMLNTALFDTSSKIPEANIILEEFGNHFYFNVTNVGMEQYGAVSCNVVTIYDQPIAKLKFPFTYGDDVMGTFSGIQHSGNSNEKISGTYEISGDAYGKLLLPNNVTVDDVLRVKQVRSTISNGSKLDEITYRWYSANIRYPILVVIKYVTPDKSYIAQTAVYAHVGDHTKAATEIASLQAITNLDAYPNPYDEQLTVSYSLLSAGNVSVDVFDASGRLMKSPLTSIQQDKGFHSLFIDTKENGFMPGVYYVRVKLNDNLVTKMVVKIRK